MAPKHNPLKLNPLQLRTLTVLQALAQVNGPGNGEKTVERFPEPHGDHFHLGDAVVATKDASGLFNEKVWHALERKGLARSDYPHRITLTPSGVVYETGVAEEILRRAPH